MKYILECGDLTKVETVTNVKFYDGNCLQGLFTKECVKDYAADEVYKDGFEDGKSRGRREALKVWNELTDLPLLDLMEIFKGCHNIGEVLRDYSFEDIEIKIEEYKNRLTIGDEVEYRTGKRYVVVKMYDNKGLKVFDPHNVRIHYLTNASDLVKTGKHYYDIEELITKMK